MGSLLFCLSIHHVVCHLKSELCIGYIDDLTVGGTLEDVQHDVGGTLEDIQHDVGGTLEDVQHDVGGTLEDVQHDVALIEREAGELGLVLNHKKSEIITKRSLIQVLYPCSNA